MILSHAEILSISLLKRDENLFRFGGSDCFSGAQAASPLYAAACRESPLCVCVVDKMHSAGLPNAAGWQPAFPRKEQRRVDTIAALRELENEPNCLDSRFPVRCHIPFILS